MIPYHLIIPSHTANKERLLWTFRTAVIALNLRHVSVGEKEDPGKESIIFPPDFATVLHTLDFTQFIEKAHVFQFNDEGVIFSNGEEDILLTAFYLANCLQEHNSFSSDPIGRYRYEDSYQKRFNKIAVNFVALLFERYFKKWCPHVLRNRLNEPTRFFVSHDIDSLYGAFLQDGLAALKGGRFDIITRLIFNYVFLRPDWFNIDKILKIESEYDLKATFFWIVNKGRVNRTLTNADYSINNVKVKGAIQLILDKGSYLGLHKSVSPESFDNEKAKLKKSVIINRNHYLRFRLPEHFDEIERSSLKIDCSLGFAEHYGFRNSLGVPFVPFNIRENRTYRFLEVPLNVMDGTFQKYMDLDPETASSHITRFIESNRQNCVLSVLWHNHFFSSYRFRGYFEPYKQLLEYIRGNKYGFISPDQLYNKYYFSV